jgi:hypothetical protein
MPSKIQDRKTVIATWLGAGGRQSALVLDTDKSGRRDVIATIYRRDDLPSGFTQIPLSTMRRIYEGELLKVTQEYLDAIHTRLALGLRAAVPCVPEWQGASTGEFKPFEHSAQAGIAAAASLEGWTNHTFMSIMKVWALRATRTEGAL